MFDSGITTLNLAVSGDPDKFIAPGQVASLIGDSDSGKTMIALTILAASFYKNGYRSVFYDIESALNFDIAGLYGKKFAKSLTVVSDSTMTVEGWQKDLRSRQSRSKKPIMCCTDSTDALQSGVDHEAADDVKNGKVKAGYGVSKAAVFSKVMPRIANSTSANGGILILLSQIRTNIGVVFGSPDMRSGGKALGFYSEQNIWMYKSNSHVIDDVKVGGWTKLDVRRNKLTGKSRVIYAPIYPTVGVDDVRAMLHFLADTGNAKWESKNMNSITFDGKTLPLAKMAENYDTPEGLIELRGMVSEAWNSRESAINNKLMGERKPRFG